MRLRHPSGYAIAWICQILKRIFSSAVTVEVGGYRIKREMSVRFSWAPVGTPRLAAATLDVRLFLVLQYG